MFAFVVFRLVFQY